MTANSPMFVFDSYAVLAYLNGEAGMARIQEVLEKVSRGQARAIFSIINLGEVLYITEREVGLAQAQAVLAALEQLPIEILPATKERVLAAAHIKANNPVAYADAFAIEAAQEFTGVILTGDPEMKAVEGWIKVEWLERER